MTRPVLLVLFLVTSPALGANPLRFERIVIDDNFPGGYQVEVADVNGDKKPDVVALGGSTLAWYENPSWKKRVISGKEHTPDIISSATADLDGDGKAEIAVAYDFAMNDPKRGKLLLAIQGKTPDEPWTFRPLGDVPSIHRLRWGDVDGDGKPELVVAPIFGPKSKPPEYHQDLAKLTAYDLGADPKSGDWKPIFSIGKQTLHAIEVRPLPGSEGRASILTAERPGVHRVDMTRVPFEKRINNGPVFAEMGTRIASSSLIPGFPNQVGKGGSSEVHLGKLADGRYFLATIDPWHGSEVAVAVALEPGRVDGIGTRPGRIDNFAPRVVLDATLDDGHALWVADVDGDGNDEVFAGHRGKDARVSVYRFDGKDWARTVLDSGLTAQDLRGGDIDGDGTPDVVAIGGRSHNVIWFRSVQATGP